MKDNSPQFKINIDLLNDLNKANANYTYFSHLAEIPEIVPVGNTHKELLQNVSISPEIYNYYNRVNMFEPFTQTERYADAPLPKHNHNLKSTPYNLKIHNAYYYRPDFISKLGSIYYDSPFYLGGKEVKSLSDLEAYFLEYAKGFNEGYVSFEEQKINFLDPTLTDKTDRLKIVFNFITARPTSKKHHWGKLTFLNQHDFTTDKEFSKAYKEGLLQGYYYKAWTIVFMQNDFFTPLFKELNQTIEQPQESDEPKRKYTAMHFALTYQLDCLANDRRPVTGTKKGLVEIAKERPKYTDAPYTFYRNCNNLMSTKGCDFNSKRFLTKVAGEDWRNIVLELSENSEVLETYLKAKSL